MPQLMSELDPSRSAQVSAVLRDRRWTTQRKFDRTFIVWSDHCDQDEAIIAATPGLPVLYSTLYGVKLTKMSYNDKEQFRLNGVNRTVWHVVCNYDSEKDAPDEGEENQPPEAKTPHVRWYGDQEAWIPTRDITGEAIENSSNQPYEPEVMRILPVLEIKRYELSPFDPETILKYTNTVNEKEFWGAPPGTVLCLPIESERVSVDGFQRESVTYRFKFRMVDLLNDDGVDPTCGAPGGTPPTIAAGEYEWNSWDFHPYDWGDGEVKVPEATSDGETRFDHAIDINDNVIGVFLDGTGKRLKYLQCDPPADPPIMLPKVRRGPFPLYFRRNFNLLSLGPF